MRSVVLESPKVVYIKEAEPLQAAKGQALVGLRQAGICGSDLSAYRGTSPLVSYPRVLGHELLVDVLDAPGSPELVGNRAVIEPLLPCGRCRACKKGRYNCCSKLQVMGVHVDGAVDPSKLITHRFGMNEPAAALKLLDHGQGHPLKIIIEGQKRVS